MEPGSPGSPWGNDEGACIETDPRDGPWRDSTGPRVGIAGIGCEYLSGAGRRRAVPNEGAARKPYSSRWHTVVCIASGPSLTAADVERVRCWRAEAEAGPSTERAVIVTNTTFRIAPWADVLYGFDIAWWKHHVEEVDRVFSGERCSQAKLPSRYRVTHLDKVPHFGNSGSAAMYLAAHRGAKRIVMLGYDCQHTGGKAHWHGNHPGKLGNAGTVKSWPAKFAMLADALEKRGVEVVNASRVTALECFQRADLETALGVGHGTESGSGIGADCGGEQ